MYAKINVSLTALLVLMSASCAKQGSPTYSLLPESNTFTQAKGTLSNKLDILWVIDNSASMGDDQTNVANNLNTFMANFIQKNYDFQIAVAATDSYRSLFTTNPNYAKFRDGGSVHSGVFVLNNGTPNLLPTFMNNVKLGTGGSGDERAFQSMKASLDSTLNAGFLRTNSYLAVIIVSDEDDFSHATSSLRESYDYTTADTAEHTIAKYVTYLDTLTATTGASRRYSVSGIGIFDSTCRSHNGSSKMGDRYAQLIDATGGVKGSLCAPNFATELDQIQNHIAELSTQFPLSRVPIESSIRVKINDVDVPLSETNGYTYQADNNSIRFHGTYIPEEGAQITVDFDPTTVKE